MPTVSNDPICSKIEKSSSKEESNLETLLVDRDVEKIIERKLGTKNFRVLQWSLDPFGETSGFLGLYFSLSVVVGVDGETKNLKFFAKTPPPPSNPQYEVVRQNSLFNKELVVYNEILSRMKKHSGPKWSPACYLGKKDTILVLEDVSYEGYNMTDKLLSYDMDHCIVGVKTLSMLHSRSLIFEENVRRDTGRAVLDIYGHLLQEVVLSSKIPEGLNLSSSGVIGVRTVVNLMEGLTDDERTLIVERVERWRGKMQSLVKASKKYKNVIAHRDTWSNNFMFKKDPNGKPVDCCIIDYQFFNYSPPAVDFAVFMCMTTDRDTIEHRYHFMADVYHETMREELASEGLDVEEYLPLEEFHESCEEMKPMGIVYAALYLQLVLFSSDMLSSLVEQSDNGMNIFYGKDRAIAVAKEYQGSAMFKKRVEDVMYLVRDQVPDHPPNV